MEVSSKEILSDKDKFSQNACERRAGLRGIGGLEGRTASRPFGAGLMNHFSSMSSPEEFVYPGAELSGQSELADLGQGPQH